MAGNDSAISHLYPGHNGSVVSNPNIVPNNRIPFDGVRLPIHCIFPILAENRKWIRGNGIGQMIGPVHDKSYIRGDHTELSDNQFIAYKVKKVLYIFFKIGHILKIIIVGKVSYNDIRVLYNIL